MERKIISTAAFLGMLAIILGAFGAHALKNVLNIEHLTTIETGVKYQMYHALFLLFIGLTEKVSVKTKNQIFYLTTVGIMMFSGSIYLLATRNITNIDFSMIGIITPIGGFFLISAWFILFYKFTTNKSQNS